jgi:hypothetical protein
MAVALGVAEAAGNSSDIGVWSVPGMRRNFGWALYGHYGRGGR